MAAAAALQHAAVAAAAARPARRRHGGALAVAARGRRSQRSGEETADAPLVGEFAMADELPQSLAAEKDSLAELLPDPANPPENLLDDSFFSSATFGSGSEWDWPQSPGDGQYESADYGATFGALDAAGGFGAAPAGGAAAADDGFFGGSDFFALQSDDWTEDFVSEVGEGSSFRRQERERYAAPGLRNMANLAHATEEELLAAAEVQALRDGQIEQVMDESIELHHFFKAYSRNKYAVAQRLGDLMEEFEYDENPLGYMQEELHPAAGEALPLWCRAVFSLADEFEEFEEEVALAEEEQIEREMAFDQARVVELLERAVSTWDVDGQSHPPVTPELLASFGIAPEAAGGRAAAPETLESMLLGVLPATSEDVASDAPAEPDSEAYAEQLMQRADGKEDAQDFMSQPIEELAREVFSDLGDIFDPATFADQEEEEEEQPRRAGGGVEAAARGSAAAAADDDEEEDSSFLLEELISDLGSFGVQGGEEEAQSGSGAAAAEQPGEKQRPARSSSSSKGSGGSRGGGKGGGSAPGLQYEFDADLFS